MEIFKDLTIPIFAIISIIEIIGQKLLIKIFFNFGIPFNRTVVKKDITNHNLQINKIYKKEEGKFKFISKTECIFTSRVRFFSFFRVDTFIPTKNICLISSGEYEIISKVPIGIWSFIIYSLIKIIFSNNELRENGSTPTSLLVCIIVMIIMYFIEHKKLAIMKEELIELIHSS